MLLALVAGATVPFNTPGLSANITVADPTFTITQAGTYRVSATVQSDLTSALGGIQLRKNGVGVGGTATLLVAGQPLALEQLLQFQAGDVIDLQATGLGLAMPAGANAQITITRA